MENENIQFVNSIELGDMLGVKAKQVRKWARQGDIPKLVLPSGRFVFDPREVVEKMKASNQAGDGDGRS